MSGREGGPWAAPFARGGGVVGGARRGGEVRRGWGVSAGWLGGAMRDAVSGREWGGEKRRVCAETRWRGVSRQGRRFSAVGPRWRGAEGRRFAARGQAPAVPRRGAAVSGGRLGMRCPGVSGAARNAVRAQKKRGGGVWCFRRGRRFSAVGPRLRGGCGEAVRRVGPGARRPAPRGGCVRRAARNAVSGVSGAARNAVRAQKRGGGVFLGRDGVSRRWVLGEGR